MDTPVVINPGETVSFPVPSDHPLAKYQQLQAVSEVENLQDLAAVRTLTNANPGLSMGQITATVSGILRSTGVSSIVVLNLPDITVAKGATMVLSGPINKLTANNVNIQGTLLVHGSLNLKCSTLGGLASLRTSIVTLPV